MRIVSISENQKIERRVAITPEIAKKYIALGFEVFLDENYGEHLGFKDNAYKELGVKISKDKKEIILCTDNDNPGIELRKELARRFGAYRCKYVDFGDYNDANEILISKGAESLRNVIKGAKNFPLEGVLNVDDIGVENSGATADDKETEKLQAVELEEAT